ncbi:MAG: hypothetical protein COB04_08555 [Gammaproteobacteria bacterium]|nr:MAG: hypothetical protein COB04_10220 [Gammaproteobacteria bacterium]PCJ17497.1 MAG: hypothetical protein COB04_08555 [Gammaproteobacteria bacterium]
MFVPTLRRAALFKCPAHLGLSLRLSRTGVYTLLVVVLLFVPSMEATAGMLDFFKKKQDVHLSPEVRGSVKLDGEPVVGLVVLRRLHYIDVYQKTQKTKTDEQGRFSFPEKSVRATEPGSIFHEPSIANDIHVLYDDNKHRLWYDVTSSLEPAKNKSEKLLQLNCDLSDSQEIIGFDNLEDPRWPHAVQSICRWE